MERRRTFASACAAFTSLITMKMKVLLPSMKERARYLVYEMNTAGNIQHAQVIEACKAYLGVFDSARAGIMPVATRANRGILRLSHDLLDKVRVSLLLISTLHATPARVHTVYVSGLLNKAKAYLTTQ
ncbi:MAG: Rpp14/Pop5 family protein [archaeon]